MIVEYVHAILSVLEVDENVLELAQLRVAPVLARDRVAHIYKIPTTVNIASDRLLKQG
jgi:hypothetical protein